ncbi:hypothetical protein [Nonomuraea sp. SYSU D8015]|uniref:hypothetical protein n=1 Tax=Nonomuraea sp. SYSU D8015 TaxID=2593644 RepID=UPI001660A480|nr:hypothetical protein [Nonomuraea sp. SYSU D8015]
MNQLLQVSQVEAIEHRTPLLGRRKACQAAGVSQATWYRKNRQGPAPPSRCA